MKEQSRLAEAGWQLVAVSSDDQSGVQKLLASYKPEPFPFLMLADPKLNVFQSYRLTTTSSTSRCTGRI